MGLHKQHAQFDRANWRVWILVPFWFAQISLLMSVVGIFSYRLAETLKTMGNEETKSSVPKIRLIWEILSIGTSFGMLCLNTVEIARYIAESLTPFSMVFTLTVRLALATAVLGLDITVYLQGIEGPFSLAGLIIDSILIVCIITPLIYTITVYRRLLQYDEYHHPANVKAYGFSVSAPSLPPLPPSRGLFTNDDGEIELLGNSAFAYSDYKSPPLPPAQLQPASSNSRPRAKSGASMMSVSSLASTLKLSGSANPRRVSTGSSMFETIGSDEIGVAWDGHHRPARETYTHERSTDFDEYVANRMSLKDGVDAAVSAEMGWPLGSRPLSAEYPGVVRSDSVVGSGSVPMQQQPRPAMRGPSWASARGLVSVPEHEEEEEFEYFYNDDFDNGGDLGGYGGSRSGRSTRRARRKRGASSASDQQYLLPDSGEQMMMMRGGEMEEGSGRKRRWGEQ